MKGRIDPKSFLGCVYGPQGSGKTLGALRAFPTGVFVATPGALTTQQWLGIEVKSLEAKGVIEATKIVRAAAKKQFPAVVFDDFNLQIDYEIRRIRGIKTGWAQWNELADLIMDFRDACLECPSLIFLTMHERPPVIKEKKGSMVTVPGQPLVPGYDLTNKFPSYFSYLAHVVPSDEAGWPFLLNTMASVDWLAKDRTAIGLPGKVPMNFGEALRVAGMDLPRPVGMEWMEDAVEKIACEALPVLKSKEELRVFLKASAKDLSKKVDNNRHVRWTIADALDRAYLKQAETDMVESFIDFMATDTEVQDDF